MEAGCKIRKKRKSTAQACAAHNASTRRRIKGSKTTVESVLDTLADDDRVLVIEKLIADLLKEQRDALRASGPIRQGRFLAMCDAFARLRREYWTVEASLDVRLSNFMPVRAMDEIRLILSKKQLEDGTWYRPDLCLQSCQQRRRVRRTAAALGIHKPLRRFDRPSCPAFIGHKAAGSVSDVCWRRMSYVHHSCE
eukprot:1529470-Pleurochrysis_carterae.AAC.1